MTLVEHTAKARRLDTLEAQILAVEPMRVRTTIEVYKRGAEIRCLTSADALRNSELDPVTELVGSAPDLDVLIDAETGTRVHRLDGDDPEFDQLAAVRVLDVVITCHEGQLGQILSSSPITATLGGTRAGKTRVLVWWLFRQWLLRGHGVGDGHDLGAVFWWVREDTTKLFDFAITWIEKLWPPEVFTGPRPGRNSKEKFHMLVDGSKLGYKGAALSGSKAGTSLRSESIQAAVFDELSACFNEENWRELKARRAQTGGPLAVAFTPTLGHWSEKIEQAAPTSGGAIRVRRLTMLDNPWWPRARMFVDILADGALTAAQLEERVLAKPDQLEALFEAVTDPHVRRMRFGEAMPSGLTLWREWTDEMIVKDRDGIRDSFRGLPCVSSATVGKYFAGVAPFKAWGGSDFNVNPNVNVTLQAFGDPRRPVVLVLEELAIIGPTLRKAEATAKLHPGMPHFCDPTGAMYMHPARGASSTKASSTDATEMKRAGLPCLPAAGSSGQTPRHLSVIDSVNVMHRAMHEGLFFVHERCSGVLRALREMQADEQGRPKKMSGTTSISDQISGYGDAVRYGVWRAYEGLLRDAASFRNSAPTRDHRVLPPGRAA